MENILNNSDLPFSKVTFGEIHLKEELNNKQLDILKDGLEKIGFELIDNRMSSVIEKVKQLVIKRARNEVDDADKKIKLSNYLASKLNYEYTHLSSLFSSVEGRTIENYFIEQRIEKAKELLKYDQLSLNEIAFELEYSSTAHLSSQFKKITGLTPSAFKNMSGEKRKSLDQV
ncbi:MAG: helix-turn-helix domain-containing protein [Bacteroidota bacterium]